MVKKRGFIVMLVLFIMLFSALPINAFATNNSNDQEVYNEDSLVDFDTKRINEGLSGLHELVTRISNYAIAFTLFVSVTILTILFFKLASSYSHPLRRRAIFEDIGVVLVTTAMLGGGGLFLRVIAGFFS